jgi:hypothetical protein
MQTSPSQTNHSAPLYDVCEQSYNALKKFAPKSFDVPPKDFLEALHILPYNFKNNHFSKKTKETFFVENSISFNMI